MFTDESIEYNIRSYINCSYRRSIPGRGMFATAVRSTVSSRNSYLHNLNYFRGRLCGFLSFGGSAIAMGRTRRNIGRCDWAGCRLPIQAIVIVNTATLLLRRTATSSRARHQNDVIVVASGRFITRGMTFGPIWKALLGVSIPRLDEYLGHVLQTIVVLLGERKQRPFQDVGLVADERGNILRFLSPFALVWGIGLAATTAAATFVIGPLDDPTGGDVGEIRPRKNAAVPLIGLLLQP
mmetsp:Transcript_23195/g.66940  ORF Transcript_23195/g.66940 Transcript_23195/m.66940 type:complete len:238 (-) Transcript_23195:168-881(-)